MKRLGGNLFDRIISIESLTRAHEKASRGKAHYTEVKKINSNPEKYLTHLHKLLAEGRFTTSAYSVIEREEGGKLRTIHRLPYFPDRIVQHAIMGEIAPRLESSLIRDTFQSLPGRGTSDLRRRVRRVTNRDEPKYYLQMDIRKYYPSVSNDGMQKCIRRFIKCPRTLGLLDDIILSHEGLPIGNYTSQILGNLYLSKLDWFIKQQLGMKGYFRYCDDLVLFAKDKPTLEKARSIIEGQIKPLGLYIKPDYKLEPLDKGLDFCGYVFYPKTLKLRQRIATAAKTAFRNENKPSITSYWGWFKPLPTRGLWNRLNEETTC